MNAADIDAPVQRFIEFLETGNAPPGLFTDDVLCDFTPPQWRLQARGPAAVLALRRHGHPTPEQVPRWRAAALSGGFVIELEERWAADGDTWYSREMAWVELRGDAIARLAVYCTGDWNSARRAAHAQQVALIEA